MANEKRISVKRKCFDFIDFDPDYELVQYTLALTIDDEGEIDLCTYSNGKWINAGEYSCGVGDPVNVKWYFILKVPE